MGIVRAMAVMQGQSNIAKDKYVNTFTFQMQAEEITPDVATNIGSSLDALYALVDPFIPDPITRLDYRLYDMEELKPREPTLVAPATQPSSLSEPYPYEVAAVLSFYGTRNLPRQRGRVFVGPLATNSAVVGEINADPQLSTAFRTAMLDGAQALHDGIQASAGDGAGAWGILSTVSGAFVPIFNAWVDNAFDTQRRRGSEATTRSVRNLNP